MDFLKIVLFLSFLSCTVWAYTSCMVRYRAVSVIAVLGFLLSSSFNMIHMILKLLMRIN